MATGSISLKTSFVQGFKAAGKAADAQCAKVYKALRRNIKALERYDNARVRKEVSGIVALQIKIANLSDYEQKATLQQIHPTAGDNVIKKSATHFAELNNALLNPPTILKKDKKNSAEKAAFDKKVGTYKNKTGFVTYTDPKGKKANLDVDHYRDALAALRVLGLHKRYKALGLTDPEAAALFCFSYTPQNKWPQSNDPDPVKAYWGKTLESGLKKLLEKGTARDLEAFAGISLISGFEKSKKSQDFGDVLAFFEKYTPILLKAGPEFWGERGEDGQFKSGTTALGNTLGETVAAFASLAVLKTYNGKDPATPLSPADQQKIIVIFEKTNVYLLSDVEKTAIQNARVSDLGKIIFERLFRPDKVKEDDNFLRGPENLDLKMLTQPRKINIKHDVIAPLLAADKTDYTYNDLWGVFIKSGIIGDFCEKFPNYLAKLGPKPDAAPQVAKPQSAKPQTLSKQAQKRREIWQDEIFQRDVSEKGARQSDAGKDYMIGKLGAERFYSDLAEVKNNKELKKFLKQNLKIEEVLVLDHFNRDETAVEELMADTAPGALFWQKTLNAALDKVKPLKGAGLAKEWDRNKNDANNTQKLADFIQKYLPHLLSEGENAFWVLETVELNHFTDNPEVTGIEPTDFFKNPDHVNAFRELALLQFAGADDAKPFSEEEKKLIIALLTKTSTDRTWTDGNGGLYTVNALTEKQIRDALGISDDFSREGILLSLSNSDMPPAHQIKTKGTWEEKYPAFFDAFGEHLKTSVKQMPRVLPQQPVAPKVEVEALPQRSSNTQRLSLPPFPSLEEERSRRSSRRLSLSKGSYQIEVSENE